MKDVRVDPSADDNEGGLSFETSQVEAARKASSNGHTEVLKELLKDPRVDPSSKQSIGKSYLGISHDH